MQQQFLAAVQAEQAAVLAAIDGVDEVALTSVPVCGTWTAKEVLGHLASIDLAVLEVVRQQRRGEPVKWAWEGYPEGTDFNTAEAARRQDWSIAQVISDLRDTQRALVAELASWPADSGPFGADSWDSEKSPFGWLPGHTNEHAAALQALRAS